MRKLLMTSTIIAGLAVAGSAMAASPITVSVGGYSDNRVGFFQQSNDGITGPTTRESVPSTTAVSGTASEVSDTARSLQGGLPFPFPWFQNSKNSRQAQTAFESEFRLNIGAEGKASDNIKYGAMISLWNGVDATNEVAYTGGAGTVSLKQANIWMSGNFGKFLLGDEQGATDLFVYAPSVGQGQVINGSYMNFTDPRRTMRTMAAGIDDSEHSTKVTFYTPKVKVPMTNGDFQAGVSYIPNLYNYGNTVVKYDTFDHPQGTDYSPYVDVIKAAARYTGSIQKMNMIVAGEVLRGDAAKTKIADTHLYPGAPQGVNANGFFSWGVGTQMNYKGATIGGSYVDMGLYGTAKGQNKDQAVWTAGAKYEMNKASVAFNYVNGKGYDNLFNTAPEVNALTHTASWVAGPDGGSAGSVSGIDLTTVNYINSFQAWGGGMTYNWFPGFTSAVDGVMFWQASSDPNTVLSHNDGYVVMLSQKLTF